MRKVISMIAVAVLCICALGATARQTETDAECLARMLWGEARGIESTAEKAACCWVVLNRVDSGIYPDAVQGVVKQPYQFHGYSPANPIEPELLAIAEDVLARWRAETDCIGSVGRVLPREYMSFWGDGAHNHFYRVVRGCRITWGWDIPSPYNEEGGAA